MASSNNKISGNVINIVPTVTGLVVNGIYTESSDSEISGNVLFIDSNTPSGFQYGIRSTAAATRLRVMNNHVDMANNDADDSGYSLLHGSGQVFGNMTYRVGSNSAAGTTTEWGNRDL